MLRMSGLRFARSRFRRSRSISKKLNYKPPTLSTMKPHHRSLQFAVLALTSPSLLCGCLANKENVLAVTGTVIGVQIHQKDADKTPELKVGYARTELAFVPTDKREETKPRKEGRSTGSARD